MDIPQNLSQETSKPLAVTEFKDTQLLRFEFIFCVVQKFSYTTFTFLKHFIKEKMGYVHVKLWLTKILVYGNIKVKYSQKYTNNVSIARHNISDKKL